MTGEITGSLWGMLQGDVLGALTAFLQLCITYPLLVPQLEVLVALLPRGVLVARLTGSGTSAAPAPTSTASAALSAAQASPAEVNPPLHCVDPVARPAKTGGPKQLPRSALWWLLAPVSRGSLAAVQHFVAKLIHVLDFTVGYVLIPSRVLQQIGKMLLGGSRTAVVVRNRCSSLHPICDCSPLPAAENALMSDAHQSNASVSMNT